MHGMVPFTMFVDPRRTAQRKILVLLHLQEIKSTLQYFFVSLCKYSIKYIVFVINLFCIFSVHFVITDRTILPGPGLFCLVSNVRPDDSS
jgi:hypothetical protein